METLARIRAGRDLYKTGVLSLALGAGLIGFGAIRTKGEADS